MYGDFTLVTPFHEQLFAYTRSLGDITALVLMNFSTSEVSLEGLIPHVAGLQLVLANYVDAGAYPPEVLRGYEGYIFVTTSQN